MVKQLTMQQFELLVLRVKDDMPDADMTDRVKELQRRLKALEYAPRFV
jgi:hypothetical protein